jgi:antitoxin HicB
MTRQRIRDPYAPAPPEIEAQAREMMRRPYRKVLSPLPEGGFLIQVPDLPGCQADGDTEAEALVEIQDTMLAWLESVIERGLPIPEPTAVPEYSGKVLVRMPKSLHRRLIERAELEGVSANQLAVTILAKGL